MAHTASSGNGRNGPLPPVRGGFRFRPNDVVILDYLEDKVLGREIPDFIPTADVYGTNPYQLPLDEFKYGSGSEWFFFATKPEHEFSTGEEISTEDGYWCPERDREVLKDNKVFGFITELAFYQGRGSSIVRTEWNINEYRLNPHGFATNGASMRLKIPELVICKIFLDKACSYEEDDALWNELDDEEDEDEYEDNVTQIRVHAWKGA